MGVSSSCPCRREKAAAPSKTSADAHNASSVGEGEAAAPAPASDYERAMRSLLVAPVDLSADALLTSMAHGVINHPASVVQRISKELRELRNNLPCSSASSIFVRYDKKRPYFMKALITGPEDTPYDSGAFVFDVFFPATYPTAAPTVLLRTTGGGTVRFNPNLYNCGKVCLSLLGTWSGSHACEKWSQQSSLLQVLVSIQGLILVKFPYFNEPGRREMLPHTPEVKYDNNGGYYHVRKNNLRWAIADAISSPPAPFAEIIHRHFSLKVAHILKVAQVWTDDDLSSHYTGEMKGVVKILKQSLATLPPPPAPEAAKPKPLPAAGATESKEDTPADEPDAAEEEAVLATGKARRRGGRAVRGTVKAAKPSATAPPPTAAKTATVQPAAKPAVAAPLPAVSEGEWVMVTPKKHRARRVLMSDSSVELVEA